MSTTDIPDSVMSIVQRFKDRGRVFPKLHVTCDNDPIKEQESKDFDALNQWRHDDSRCTGQIANHLDAEMPGWRGEQYYLYLPKAQHIVNYYKQKQNFMLPTIQGNWQSSKQSFEEYRSLCASKAFISQVSEEGGCPSSLLAYLNREAPNWLSVGQCKVHARLDEGFVKAEGIVERYIARGKKLPKEWRNHKNDPVREQEYKDAQKLCKWKESMKRVAEGRPGKGGHCCPPELQTYLDTHMGEWRAEARARNVPPMQRAQGIVARYRERGNVLPRQLLKGASPDDHLQEFKDAVRLKDWRRALRRGKGGGKCDDDVRMFLDANMPSWRQSVYAKRRQVDIGGSGDADTSTSVAGSNNDVGDDVGTGDGAAGDATGCVTGGSGIPRSGTGTTNFSYVDDNVISISIASSSASSNAVGCDSSSDITTEGGAAHVPTRRAYTKRAQGVDVGGTAAVAKRARTATSADKSYDGGSDPAACAAGEHAPPSSQSLHQLLQPPSSASTHSTHDDKEISAAAGLVAAAYSTRVV